MHKHKSSMSDCVVSISKQGVERERVGRCVGAKCSVVSRQRPVGVIAAHAVPRVAQEDLNWVLLLDDDPVNTRCLSRWLKQTLGIETRSARTIQQAERWLASMPAPCAIVSDFDLEGSDTAVTALKRFRALGVESKALVLTGAPIRARAALSNEGWFQTPVLSKANFQTSLAQWLGEGTTALRRFA